MQIPLDEEQSNAVQIPLDDILCKRNESADIDIQAKRNDIERQSLLKETTVCLLCSGANLLVCVSSQRFVFTEVEEPVY